MATDQKIQPALTTEEWAAIAAHPSNEPNRHSIFGDIKYLPDEHRSAAIAYLNALLPDDDPRKITADDVDIARGAFNVGDDRDAMYNQFAAKLAALLPPTA